MTVVATYWVYGSQCTEDFDTFDAAIQFLETGEEYGSLSAESVSDGTRTIEGEELRKLQWTIGTDDYKSQDWIEGTCEELPPELPSGPKLLTKGGQP